jgi:BMFP domain-containing protein YqiC
METTPMIDLRIIDELTRKLSDALPPGLSQAKQDFEQQIKTILSRGLERMEVVSREEFEAQRTVLARTEKKLEQLEQQLNQMQNPEPE